MTGRAQMSRQVRWSLLGAAMLGFSGFAFAWYAAATSREAELAREYLMTASAISARHKSVDGLTLTGFRMASSRSHLIYWASTPSNNTR